MLASTPFSVVASTPSSFVIAGGANLHLHGSGNKGDPLSLLPIQLKSRTLPFYRSFGIGNPLGRLRHFMWLLMRLGFLLKGGLASSGKTPEKLKGAGSFLMKVFGVLAGKGAKCVGALYVTCQLFKIYFKLGKVNLCQSVIRSIETARIFDFEEFPARYKVTYIYYTGRLEVFQ